MFPLWLLGVEPSTRWYHELMEPRPAGFPQGSRGEKPVPRNVSQLERKLRKLRKLENTYSSGNPSKPIETHRNQPLKTIEPLMWGQPTSLWAGLWLKKSSIKETCRKAQVPEHFWIFKVWWLPNCQMSAFRGSYESPKWIVAADLSCHVIKPINKHISWTCFSDYRPKCQNFGCFVWLVDPSLLHGCHVVVPWWRRHEIPGAGLLGRAASPAWRMLCQDAALAGAGDSGDWSDWWVPSTKMPLVSMRCSCLSTWIMIYYDGFAWFWRWFWYHKNGPDMVEEFGMFVEVSIDDYRHRCIYTEHHSGKTVKDFKL